MGVDADTLAYAWGGADLCQGMTAIAAPLNRLRAGVVGIVEGSALWAHGVVPLSSLRGVVYRNGHLSQYVQPSLRSSNVPPQSP